MITRFGFIVFIAIWTIIPSKAQQFAFENLKPFGRIIGVTHDSSDNIYALLSFGTQITVGDTTYNAFIGSSAFDILLLKYNPEGEIIWHKRPYASTYNDDQLDYIGFDNEGYLKVITRTDANVLIIEKDTFNTPADRNRYEISIDPASGKILNYQYYELFAQGRWYFEDHYFEYEWPNYGKYTYSNQLIWKISNNTTLV